MIRYTKTSRAAGVDGFYDASHPDVTVAPSELPAPLYPEDARFWGQLEAVLHCAAVMRDPRRLENPHCIPAAFSNLGARDMQAGAQLVRADPPTQIMTEAVRLVGSSWRDIPGLQGSFTNKAVLLADAMGWAARAVSPNSFAAKWQFMVPRPEEVVAAVLSGAVDAPWAIRTLIEALGDTADMAYDPRKLTQFPEGSPNHPSYNAMHAAAAGAQLAVAQTLLQLNSPNLTSLRRAAHAMAYYRTWAGVHYPMDNTSGLWLGYETVRRGLPAHLAQFGADPVAVQAALPVWHKPEF
jgi:hypothetical protein